MTCDFRKRKMGKVLVCGAGQMGRAAAFALTKLGHDVMIVDTDDAQIELVQRLKICDGYLCSTWFGAITTFSFDLVFSCLPFHQNHCLAKYCIDNGIRYADLGGDPETENKIKADSVNAKKPLALSLGLAPGYVNIITEHLIQENGIPTNIRMYVGGLPQLIERNTWDTKYGLTWSIDGLVNEYRAKCYVLSGGEIKERDAFDGYDLPESGFESFYTSGGISHSLEHFQRLGVKNASYNTLRYEGHTKLVKPLIKNLSFEEAKGVFKKIFPVTQTDLVKMKIELDYYNHGTEKVTYNNVWYSDIYWTAMQKTTTFPAAAVCCQLINGNFDSKKLVEYQDINPTKFFLSLEKLGL